MTRDDAEARERKARAFADAAELVQAFDDADRELGDVYVTLCVHAGIAAADAICLRRLGRAHRVGTTTRRPSSSGGSTRSCGASSRHSWG